MQVSFLPGLSRGGALRAQLEAVRVAPDAQGGGLGSAFLAHVLDECRRRVQLATCGHRGRKTDPLYASRRTLQTGADLLTDKQRTRLQALFAADEHAEVEATWGIYQRMIAAYREPDRKTGRAQMTSLIASISRGVPVDSNAQLVERAVEAGRLAQRTPMTTAGARSLLGLTA